MVFGEALLSLARLHSITLVCWNVPKGFFSKNVSCVLRQQLHMFQVISCMINSSIAAKRMLWSSCRSWVHGSRDQSSASQMGEFPGDSTEIMALWVSASSEVRVSVIQLRCFIFKLSGTLLKILLIQIFHIP